MEKITKETCVVFIKDILRSKIIAVILLPVFFLLFLWNLYRQPMVVFVAAAVLIPLQIVYGKKIKEKINNIDLLDFYITEDSVLKIKKKLSSGRGSSGWRYVYTFKKHGEYSIRKRGFLDFEFALHKEKNIRLLSVDKAALESSEPGDLFYLLILNENEKKKIVKCFYRYFYDLAENDFSFKDGKYYCKK